MQKHLWIVFILFMTVQISAQEVEPLSTCTEDEINTANELTGEYSPSSAEGFIRLENSRLSLNGEHYPVRGINYYPAQYPWRRFLVESDLDVVRQELNLLNETNLNTLRIFLWNEALFQCFGSGAVPNPWHFQRLDAIIQMAGELGFRLIVTLNDLPDLEQYPLYSNPPHNAHQTAYIIGRYRDEGAILAWDVRNEGDIDYGTHPNIRSNFERETVLNWLNTTTQTVRTIDNNHLITAGWLYDAESTAPYVDFISFHHWTNSAELAERIATMQAVTDKPILLQEVGYSTFSRSERQQANALQEVLTATEDADLLGWLVWAAFDFPRKASCFPSPCHSQNNQEHYFGLWRSDYTEKLAVDVIRDR